MSFLKKNNRVLRNIFGALLLAAACGGIIYFAIFSDGFFPVFSAFLRAIWWTCKASGVILLLGSIFFLCHPLIFHLKMRGTPAGQRGHLRFSHLFGLLWIDGGGSIHGQEVRLGFWRWSWRISDHLRERPPRKGETGSPPKKPDSPTPEKTAAETSRPQAPCKTEQPSEKSGQTAPALPPSRDETPAPVAVVTTPETRSDVPPAPPTEEKSPEDAVPTIMREPEPPEQKPSIPFAHPTPLPGKSQEQAPSTEKPFFEKLRDDVRRIRRRALDGWRKLRAWINLARRAWRRASPMTRRLGSDLWQAMHLLPSLCRVRYGMPEAHLTGLTQGLAAPFAGLLRPFSISFEPIPVFTGTTLYVRVDGGFRIQPWRVIWAWIVLLSTLDFWKALRDAWHWHKGRSEASNR